jgi:hypothetical protein
MEELIAKIQEKAEACGYSTKEDRARKGAYVDCIMEMKEALRIHSDVVGREICGCGNPIVKHTCNNCDGEIRYS